MPPPTPRPSAAAMAALSQRLASATAWARVAPRARRAAIAEDSVQPVPWVWRVGRRGRLEPDLGLVGEQQVGAVVAAQMAALEQDIGRPERAQARRRRYHLRAIGRRRARRAGRPASGRFGVIRSASGRRRARRAPIASLPQQAVAALGHHHRVEHDVGRPPGGEALGHGGHASARAEHADLDRSDAEVAEHRVHLAPNEARLDGVDRLRRPGCSARSAR